MEQLTSDAVRQLLAQGLESVRTPAGGAGGEALLWARRRRKAATATLPGTPAAAAPAADLPALPGIERRLARRAELLWTELRGAAAMPPTTAAARLLSAPLGGHMLLVRRAGPGEAEIGFAGTEVGALGDIALGPVRATADAGAPIAERLAALGLAALAAGAPAYLDSDLDPDLARGNAPLLFRAVALPLAGPDGAAECASVVVSWRRLLSDGETAALHRELQSAIGWLSGSLGAR